MMYGPPGGQKPQRPKGFCNLINYWLKSGKALLRRLVYIYALVWDCRPWILLLLAFMALFNGVAPVFGAYISKLLIDRLSLAAVGELSGGFWALGGFLVLQLLYQFFLMLVGSVNSIVTRLSNEVLVYSIRLKIMNKAKTVDLSSFDLPEFYSKLENANREAGGRPLQILSSTFSIVSSTISLVSFIVLLASILPWAPTLIVLMALPSAIIHYQYRNKMFQFVRRRSKDRRQMDYYSGLLTQKDIVKEVKLFDLSETFIGKYKEVFGNYYNGVKKIIISEGVWGIVLSLLNMVANGSVLIRVASMVFDRRLTVGDFSLYSNALLSISTGVSTIVNTSAGIYEGTLFIDNMIAFMEEEPKIVPSLPAPRTVKRHCEHTIEFRHVSFCYPGTNKKVLDDVNTTIRHGQTVVLVGLNGAGKTTFLKLLTRLYDPTEGVILLDGCDIREYSVQELYRIFGIIFQDFGKYAFTVAENIGFGQIENIADRGKVAKAAAQSSASEFIEKLPEDFDTPLTRVFEQQGIELSIGQWQKIAVARAFFRDSDIVILDEPTASLDPMAEQEIFRQFDTLRENKTTIFVSHRLSSATSADKIIVMEYGKIVEEGSHRELMARKGKYETLFTTQAQRYLEKTGNGCDKVS